MRMMRAVMILLAFVSFAACRSTETAAADPTAMLEEVPLPDEVVLVAGVGRPTASYAVAARLLAAHREQHSSLWGMEIPPSLPEMLAQTSLAPLAAALDWERPLRMVALDDGTQTIVLAHLTAGDAGGLPEADGAPLALPGFHVMRMGSVVALLSSDRPLDADLRRWLQTVASCPQRADVSLVVNIAGSRRRGSVIWRSWAEAIRAGESHVDLGPLARSVAPVVEAADRAVVSLAVAPDAVTVDASLTLAPGSAPWAAFTQVLPHPTEALRMAGPDTVAVVSLGLGEGLPRWLVDKATAALRKEDLVAAAAAGVLLSDLRAPAVVVESTGERPALVASWLVSRPTDARDRLFTLLSRVTTQGLISLIAGTAVIEATAAIGDDPLDLWLNDHMEAHFGVVRGRGVIAVGQDAQPMLRREPGGPTSEGVRRALERGIPDASAFAWASTSWLQDPSGHDASAPPGAGISLTAGAADGALRARLDVPDESLGWLLARLADVVPAGLPGEESLVRRRREDLEARASAYSAPVLRTPDPDLPTIMNDGEPMHPSDPTILALPPPPFGAGPVPVDVGSFGVVKDVPIEPEFEPLSESAPLPTMFPAAEPWE